MKVLVTGSTGLLGSDIVYSLEQHGKSAVKTCYSERGCGYISADITSDSGIEKLSRLDWDFVVHTSAWRSPDQCENKKEEAYKLNTWAAEQIAETAKAKKAGMLFISTDYVFSGSEPPYSEEDTPDPINYYGKTKAIAEESIANILDNYIILRIPLLYGTRAGLAASDVLNTAVKVLNSDRPVNMDNTITRYPTYTGDVAEAVNFLIDKKAKGIYHFSGQDKVTKYLICKIIAKILEKDTSNIIKKDTKPDGDAAERPQNSHLSMNRLLSEGFELPLPFKQRVRKLMKHL